MTPNQNNDLPLVQHFWRAYVVTLPPKDQKEGLYFDAAFAGNEHTTDELIGLYLEGKKIAGSSLVKDFETAGDPLPQVGNHWIALDSKRNPVCILRTLRTVIFKFKDVTPEVAQDEGEGDLSVDYWKAVHRSLYTPFLNKWGVRNLDEAEVITEYFEIVYAATRSGKHGITIRELSSDLESEILLVAQRMRKTLIDVLGVEKGTALYGMEALLDRVRWHLDSANRIGKVYVSQDHTRNITGQTLARVESDDVGAKYGRFSMIYVEPEYRQQGIATRLIATVERWFRDLGMPKIIYNTGETNQQVIDLFLRRGYRVTHSESEMVQLTKVLTADDRGDSVGDKTAMSVGGKA